MQILSDFFLKFPSSPYIIYIRSECIRAFRR